MSETKEQEEVKDVEKEPVSEEKEQAARKALPRKKSREQSEREHMEFAKIFDRPWAANWTPKAKKFLGLP